MGFRSNKWESRLPGHIRERNDLTLAELCERVSQERGVRVSVPTMYRALRRLGLPHQKS